MCFVTENYGTVRLFIFAVSTLDSRGNFERNVAKFFKGTERILQMLGITFIE